MKKEDNNNNTNLFNTEDFALGEPYDTTLRSNYVSTFQSLFKSQIQSISISQWAGLNRIIPPGQSSKPGRWNPKTSPFLNEIMDNMSPSAPYKQITVMKNAQIGMSEAMRNIMGYYIDQAPCPMMLVMSNKVIVDQVMNGAIETMFRTTDCLKDKIYKTDYNNATTFKDKKSYNTTNEKTFIGGRLFSATANSEDGLSSRPAQIIFADEVDKYRDTIGKGSRKFGAKTDPIAIMIARTNTFSNHKIMFVSTPKNRINSEIYKRYCEGDQRRYFVPCPHCSFSQILIDTQLQWNGEVAVYRCEHCGALIDESLKQQMLEKGKWIATATPKNRFNISYHLNALYSPLGFISWTDILYQKEQSKANGTYADFKRNILGKPWGNNEEVPSINLLMSNRTYNTGTIPTSIKIITCGVDVQQNRLAIELIGWTSNMESFSLSYQEIFGNTKNPRDDVWQKLKYIIEDRYIKQDGKETKISFTLIDSGYASEVVYPFTRQWAFGVLPVKGSGGIGKELIKVHDADPIRGVNLITFNDDDIKGEIYKHLRITVDYNQRLDDTEDSTTLTKGFGYCNFPRDYTQNYFDMLTDEHLVVKMVNGRDKLVWEKFRDRNESLDTRKYCYLALLHYAMMSVQSVGMQQLEWAWFFDVFLKDA